MKAAMRRREKDATSFVSLVDRQVCLEFYDHGPRAEEFNGRDVATIVLLDAACLAAALGLAEGAPGREVVEAVLERFDSFWTARAWLDEQKLPYLQEVDDNA